MLRCFQRLSLSEQSPHHAVRNIRSFCLHLCIGPQGTSQEVAWNQSTFNRHKTVALHQQSLHCICKIWLTSTGGRAASTEVALHQRSQQSQTVASHQKRLNFINNGCIASTRSTIVKAVALHQQGLALQQQEVALNPQTLRCINTFNHRIRSHCIKRRCIAQHKVALHQQRLALQSQDVVLHKQRALAQITFLWPQPNSPKKISIPVPTQSFPWKHLCSRFRDYSFPCRKIPGNIDFPNPAQTKTVKNNLIPVFPACTGPPNENSTYVFILLSTGGGWHRTGLGSSMKFVLGMFRFTYNVRIVLMLSCFGGDGGRAVFVGDDASRVFSRSGLLQ